MPHTSDDTRRTSITRTGLALALVTLAFAGCSSDKAKDSAPAGPTVVIKGRAFTPADLTVDAGQTVTWRFEDGSTEHTVTGATFHSERMSKGTFEQTFNQPGTSTYQCTVHPTMKGTITVR